MKKHRKFLKDLQTSEQFYNDQESRQIIGELIAMIDEGYNMQPKTDWIPCEERLPSEDGKYIVCTTKGSVYCAKYSKKHSTNYGFHTDSYTHIIAWQPLPQPYKNEGAE